MRNVTFLEDYLVSHILSRAKEFELGEESNSHGRGRDQEDNVFHLERDSMHFMTTNDEKYDKFRPNCRTMKNMT